MHISIDDFGTGFSSIAVLKELSVDYIKIDKSFIDNISTQSKGESIVSAVTKMSHMIGCKVIAEGVETEAQWRTLKRLNCDYCQGFLFSKALPFEKFLQRVKKIDL